MSGYIGTTPVPQATQHREAFTANANQTTFATAGYTVGYIDVWVNGVKLAAADVTVTNGSDIVLASAAAANDIVEYLAFVPFEAVNQTFTGATVVNSLNLNGDGATVTGIKDEDNMASNDANKLATQQSIKAYVDSTVAATNEVVEDTTPQLGGDLASNGNDILMADNDKAIFGAGSDLQIYHHNNGSSYIQETGSGDLNILGSNFRVMNAGGTENKIVATSDGSVDLYHNNLPKLATTSTGIDVTGTVTSGELLSTVGLKVAGHPVVGYASFDSGYATRLGSTGSSTLNATQIYAGGVAQATFKGGNVGIGDETPTELLEIAGSSDPTLLIRHNTADNASSGKISFRENAGGSTGADLRYDGAANKFIIDTSDVSNAFVINRTDGAATFAGAVTINNDLVVDTATNAKLTINDNIGEVGAGNLAFQASNSSGSALKPMGFRADDIRFATGSSERMRIDSSGTVAVGTTVSPTWTTFDGRIRVGARGVVATTTASTQLIHNAYYDGAYKRIGGTDFASRYYQNDGAHVWNTAVSGAANSTISFVESMRIDGSGNLLVGKTVTSSNTDGTTLWADGYLNSTVAIASANTSYVARFNRKTTDGPIVDLQKDGTTVGSIGSTSGVPYFAGPNSSTGGIRIDSTGSNGVIMPTTNTGANRDAATDLGYSSGGTNVRFRDLYLSGGTYLGGTGAANKLEDYEEGTFQMTVSGVSSSAFGYGTYVKVGALVHWQWYSGSMNVTGSGSATLSGLPFTTSSSTGYYSTFSTGHSTYAGTATNGYLQVGGTNAYITTANTTSSAAYVAGGSKYIMASGTYFTDL